MQPVTFKVFRRHINIAVCIDAQIVLKFWPGEPASRVKQYFFSMRSFKSRSQSIAA